MSADLAIRPDVLPGIRIADVIVGERARRDYGDLTPLMESIRDVGLLQPIGLTPGSHLLFGGRRLEACRALGWESIPFVRPTTREDALSLLKAERDENTCRKDMTPEELVDLGMRLEEMEQAKANARKAEAGRTFGRGMDSSRPIGRELSGENPESAQVVGEALGLSKNTYKRMKAVVVAAREETDPEVQEVAGAALADLNAGKATPFGAAERIRRARKAGPNVEVANLAMPQPPKFGGNRRKHLQVMQAMTTALAGLAGAADEITELDNSVTKEEAAQLVRDLSQQIRSLNQIKNLLKERIR